MKGLDEVSFRRRFFALGFQVALAFAFATAVSAQTASDRPPRGADSSGTMAERDLSTREWQLRNLGRIKRVDINVEPTTIRLSQVKDDYEGIQSANNDILRMLSSGGALDYKVIATSSSEIKKRASHLRSYIIALQLADEGKSRGKNSDEIAPEEMKASLLSLDASIVRVISSPIFKNFGKVIDKENSTKARSELDSIIELSERIKRSAEQNMKTARAAR